MVRFSLPLPLFPALNSLSKNKEKELELTDQGKSGEMIHHYGYVFLLVQLNFRLLFFTGLH